MTDTNKKELKIGYNSQTFMETVCVVYDRTLTNKKIYLRHIIELVKLHSVMIWGQEIFGFGVSKICSEIHTSITEISITSVEFFRFFFCLFCFLLNSPDLSNRFI